MTAPSISPGSPVPADLDLPGVHHISYDERHCADAASCLAEIRARLVQGWWLTQVSGTSPGPFALVFRRDARG